MSDECECPRFIIFPPEGTTFKECALCKNPFVYNGTLENCLWCEINNGTPPSGNVAHLKE